VCQKLRRVKHANQLNQFGDLFYMELRPIEKDGNVQVKVPLRTVQEGGNKTGRNA